MGAAAFWIALAAVLIAGGYFRSRREALKHETIRLIVDKTGQVDEAKLKEIFQPPAPPAVPMPPPWAPAPGSGYRMMRIFGTLALAVAAGLAISFAILYQAGVDNQYSAMIGFAWAIVVAAAGVGLFVASQYLPPPPPDASAGRDRG
jgi:hypothetical protein